MNSCGAGGTPVIKCLSGSVVEGSTDWLVLVGGWRVFTIQRSKVLRADDWFVSGLTEFDCLRVTLRKKRAKEEAKQKYTG